MDRMNASFPSSSYRATFQHGEPEPFAGSLPFHLAGDGAPDDLDSPLGADFDARDGVRRRQSGGSAGSAELEVLLTAASRRSSASSASMIDYLDLVLRDSFGASFDDADLRFSGGSERSRSRGSRSRGSRSQSRGRSAASSSGPRRERPHLPTSQPGSDPRLQMQAVNFDPPSLAWPAPALAAPRQAVQLGPNGPVPVPRAGESRRRVPDRPAVAPPPSPAQQRSAQLSRLAESMKRTGESRRCVMLQRELLFTPGQRRQLAETKDELRRCTQRQCLRLQQQREWRGPPPPAAAAAPWASPPPPGADAAAGTDVAMTPRFLMEQSRQQLRVYMETTL